MNTRDVRFYHILDLVRVALSVVDIEDPQQQKDFFPMVADASKRISVHVDISAAFDTTLKVELKSQQIAQDLFTRFVRRWSEENDSPENRFATDEHDEYALLPHPIVRISSS